MSDLHQTGIVSTLHRFHTSSLEQLEGELEHFSLIRPITLVLPALYDELHREALKRIVSQLKKVKYLHQIIVTLGDTDSS